MLFLGDWGNVRTIPCSALENGLSLSRSQSPKSSYYTIANPFEWGQSKLLITQPSKLTEASLDLIYATGLPIQLPAEG